MMNRTSLLLVLCPLLLLSFQEAPKNRPEQGSALDGARKLGEKAALKDSRPEVLGPDGKPLIAGRLPETATVEAKRAWRAICDKTTSETPITSFRIDFFVRAWQDGQSNDVNARFDFLRPNYIRALMKDSGRMHLRGDKGDFLIDGEEVIRLVGREGAEDIKQIDHYLGIAQNFTALANPRSLRISGLWQLKAAPEGLPKRLEAQAAKLEWLQVESPDFHLSQPARQGASKAVPFYEAFLGVDRESSAIQLAVVQPKRKQRASAIDLKNPGTTLLELEKYKQLNGAFYAPHQIKLYQLQLDETPGPYKFQDRFSLRLNIDRGTLRAGLKPAYFLPR